MDDPAIWFFGFVLAVLMLGVYWFIQFAGHQRRASLEMVAAPYESLEVRDDGRIRGQLRGLSVEVSYRGLSDARNGSGNAVDVELPESVPDDLVVGPAADAPESCYQVATSGQGADVAVYRQRGTLPDEVYELEIDEELEALADQLVGELERRDGKLVGEYRILGSMQLDEDLNHMVTLAEKLGKLT